MAVSVMLISPVLPPAVDGIGDYSARLASAVAVSAGVDVVTSSDCEWDPIAGTRVVSAFSLYRRNSVGEIPRRIVAGAPGWVVLQYCAFAYGRWGLNPYLPLAMRRAKRACPGTRFALMVHEPLAWPINWKLRLMNVWQRWQLRELGRTADVIFFSIDPWVRQFRSWFSGTPIYHLPVGSNVPRTEIRREEARRRLGIPDGRLVCGLFGTAHHSRLLHWVGAAVRLLRGRGIDACVLYIGPHGEVARAAMLDVPAVCEGPLPAEEVSRRFSAMDIYLAPFADGISTRRGSLMTGLDHGRAIAATQGPLTDDMLLEEDGRAFLLSDVADQEGFTANVVRLAEDAALRAELERGARSLHAAEFAWEHIAGRMLEILRRHSGRATAGEADGRAP